MTPKEKKLVDYAKYIVNSKSKDDVIERIAMSAFKSFRFGTYKERVVASSIVDSMELFFTELNTIIAEHIEPNPEDDIEEDIER